MGDVGLGSEFLDQFMLRQIMLTEVVVPLTLASPPGHLRQARRLQVFGEDEVACPHVSSDAIGVWARAFAAVLNRAHVVCATT